MLVRIVGGHGGVSPGFRSTSYLIDGKLLIDAGSCATGLQVEDQLRIDNILISHSHLDHIKDLAFIADNCFGMKDNPFEIWTNKFNIDAIRKHLLNDEIWPDFSKLPDEENPTLHFNEIVPEKELKIAGYTITPVRVNHFCEAMGFIVEKKDKAVLFTQDTGPTDKIWEIGKQKVDKLKAIFCEVSFPNSMKKVADDSLHHTANSLKDELQKMPADVPIFLGHLKPTFQAQLYKEIEDIGDDRINILGSDDSSYLF